MLQRDVIAAFVQEDGLFGGEMTASEGPFRLNVRVTDQQGNHTDTIGVAPYRTMQSQATGSDAGSLGAWPERHLFGTQLGPSRYGTKW